jgi:GntR family transcriptional regulator
MTAQSVDASLDALPARQLIREDGGPLYRQLAAILRTPIVGGRYRVGMALPKEADLADRFGISLITVRQALRELEADGLIRKRSAKRAVVTSNTAAPKLSSAFRNFADIDAYTTGARLEIASYRREPSKAAAAALGISSRGALHCLRGTLVVGGRSEAHITSYFPPEVGRRLKLGDFDDVLIFRAVQKHLGIRIAAARITVRAENATADIARHLDYVEGGPILAMEMLYRSLDQKPVEFTIARHRADLFSLVYEAPNDIG